MRFIYALVALAIFSATPALAQFQPEQPGLDNVALRVTGNPDIATTIFNYTNPLPPNYFPQDSSGTFYITYSAFTTITNPGTPQADTTSGGTPVVGAGVTGQAVVARRADGSQALGCITAADLTSDIANAAAFAGKMVMIRRGECPFSLKAQRAEAGGAVGFVVFNGDDREGTADNVTSLLGGGPAPGQPKIGIPGALVPNGIGQPIVDELTFGGTVTLQLFDRRAVAAEQGPATTVSGLEVRGANPFSVSTALHVYTESAEAVRVDVFNVRGQLVANLFTGTVAGERALTLSSAGLAPGVYFVRATGETFRSQQQLTIVR